MKEETIKNINKIINFIKTIVSDRTYESIRVINDNIISIKYKGIIDEDKFYNVSYAFITFNLYPSSFTIDYDSEYFPIDYLDEDKELNEVYKKLYNLCYQRGNAREIKIKKISDVINIMEEYYK